MTGNATAEKERLQLEKQQQGASETEMLTQISDRPADFGPDIEWAYNNLGNVKITPLDAPSGTAWHILQYGREARAAFLKFCMDYFMKQKAKDAEDQERRDDERRQMGFLEALKSVRGKRLVAT